MPKAKRTLVTVVQDESGSMAYRQAETINGFNEYIENLKREGEGEILVTLTKFNTRTTTPVKLAKVGHVARLNEKTYQPGGMTALFDAVYEGIKATEKEAKKRDNVVFVIMTDGQENSSREVTRHQVADLIAEKRDEGWDFVFLGAGEDAWSGAGALGISAAATLNYAGDAHAHSIAYHNLSQATVRKHRGVDATLAFNKEEKALEDDAKRKNSISS